MAGKGSWAAVADNELVCHDEIVLAVAAGALAWSAGNPGLAGGYCYTRTDYATHVSHNAGGLAGSGIGALELMTKAQMLAYATTVAITGSNTQEQDTGSGWRARVQFDVNAQVNSVRVETALDGGAYSVFETINVTPGSSGNFTSYRAAAYSVNIINWRLTPFSGSGGGGTAGPQVTLLSVQP